MSSIWLSPKDIHRETRGQAGSHQDQLPRSEFRRPASFARNFRPIGLPGWASLGLITLISATGLWQLNKEGENYYPLRVARKLESEDSIQQAYVRRLARERVWLDVKHEEGGLYRHGMAAQAAEQGDLPPLSLWPLLAKDFLSSPSSGKQ